MRNQGISAAALLLQLHSCMAAPTTIGKDTSLWKGLNFTNPNCDLMYAGDRKKSKRCGEWEPVFGLGPEIAKRAGDESTATPSSAEPTASSIFETYKNPWTALNLTGNPFLDCPMIARRGLIADFCPTEPVYTKLNDVDGTSTTITGDRAVSGEDEKRSVPFPTNVASFPAGGPSGFKSIWTELTDRDAPAEASPNKRSSTLKVPHEPFKAEKGTTTDSAKRSVYSGLLSDCFSIVRRGEALPKRCEGINPTQIVNTLPVWDVEGGIDTSTEPVKRRSMLDCAIIDRRGDFVVRRCADEEGPVNLIPEWLLSSTSETLPKATGGSDFNTVNRRIVPPCPGDTSGGCEDTSALVEEQEKAWRITGAKPGVEAAAKRRVGLGMDKRIVLRPGEDPIDTPTHIGDLTLHIG